MMSFCSFDDFADVFNLVPSSLGSFEGPDEFQTSNKQNKIEELGGHGGPGMSTDSNVY